MSPEQLRGSGHRMGSHRLDVGHDNATTAIAVIGLGYVGLPLAILASQQKRAVIGFDIDEVKIAQLERREANFLTARETADFTAAESLRITSSERDLDHADVFIICVPTPVTDEHVPDLGPLISASEIVGRHIREGSLVVVESTVSPGICEGAVLPALEKWSALSPEQFHLAHCPERINPGDQRWDVRTIPRVIGASSDEGLVRAIELYRSFIDAEIVPMKSIKEAEAVKMVENSFRDINIAFVNELAMAFDKAGIDIVNVIEGAATKPFSFMPHLPGCGVGGHCIPVDPYYLIRYGRENGFEHQFLSTARRVNRRMPSYTVKLLDDALAQVGVRLHGTTVALLGLAYKRGVGDLRESPALEIRELLEQHGAIVQAFDPHVHGAESGKSLDAALDGATAVVIATDHQEFRALTPSDLSARGIAVVIDGRNMLDKAAFTGSGVVYRGIGRGMSV